MANYGLSYMGSKNSIAHIIIDVLPSAENLYDLFGGGGSITHCALLSNKYKKIILNDIEKGLPQLFMDAVQGKYRKENRWISREEFEREKENDAYIRYIWSFGNNGTGYLYNKKIEPYKKAYWYAVMFDDFSLFHKLGIDIPKISGKTYKEKRIKIGNYLKSLNKQLQNLESLERLERLQSLERLERLQSLEISNKSYDEIEIKDNSVVYCDIPYENTAKYVSGDFNHRKFYDWAYKQKELVVISGYEISDSRFQRVINLKKHSNLQGGTGKMNNEGLFVAVNKIDKWKEMRGT